MIGKSGLPVLMLGAVFTAVAAAAVAQQPRRLAVFSRVQPGLWQVRELGTPSARPRAVCLSDPQLLMQIEHRGLPCSSVVLANSREAASVHYTCPAGGYGRTSARYVSSRLVTIDTQGIRDRRPFAYRADGRRIRTC